MKTILYVFAATALLCGCQKSDPKITALEEKVAYLQKHIATLDEQIERLKAMETNDYNFTLSVFSLTTNQVQWISADRSDLDAAQARIASLETWASSKGSIKPSQYTAPVQSGQMPAFVAAQIRADAEKEWPNDYDMQIYRIKNQTEAWYKLHQ